MRTLIVGGDFGDNPKESSVINKLGEHFIYSINWPGGDAFVNGGSIEDLVHIASNAAGYELIIWMPNLENLPNKIYPKKDPGAVLVCSKVLRPDRDRGDAVARIFRMNGNAVITVNIDQKPYKFELIDALANKWWEGSDIEVLASHIKDLFIWTKQSIRLNSKLAAFDPEELVELDGNMNELCEIVHTVADRVENERGGRYFGNISTRCAAMFPSMRVPNNIVLMSARNSPKTHLTWEDFVPTKLIDNTVLYHGDKKPSVDAPIQLSLYAKYPELNFLIHGHAFLKDMPFTEHYFPCGDMREFEAVTNLLDDNIGVVQINLKNHGFLIGTRTLDGLKYAVENVDFEYRELYKQIGFPVSLWPGFIS